MSGLAIRKKDKVVVLSGKDRGKRGEVLRVYPSEGRMVIGKINFVKRHARTTPNEPGGIREQEAPLAVAKVMLVCPKCDKPTRARHDRLADGSCTRACRRCGELIL